MPAVTSIIAGIGTAAAVGGAVESKRRTDIAVKEGEKQEKATASLLAEEEKKRRQTAFSVLKRRRGGKERPARETILTSPIGVSGAAGQAGKKLLGE